VLLELSEQMPANLYGSLISDAWFQRVLPDGATSADARAAALGHAFLLQRSGASAGLGGLPPALAQGLRLRLERMYFFHALLAASHGDLVFARASASEAGQLDLLDPRFERLLRALPDKGRLSPGKLLGGAER
jgi:hypothetical protein